MTTQHSRIHKINPSALIPQVAIGLSFIFLLYLAGVTQFILLGISVYFLLAAYLKIIIPRNHRVGLKYFKRKEYEGAAFAFQNSYNFFKKFEWLDKNRAYFLLSVSALSYTEMALGNASYCFKLAGKKKEAKKFEERLKLEFPNSKLLKR